MTMLNMSSAAVNARANVLRARRSVAQNPNTLTKTIHLNIYMYFTLDAISMPRGLFERHQDLFFGRVGPTVST